MNELKAIASTYLRYSDNFIMAAPNVFGYVWESDLLAITKSDLVIEYEIKSSVADFKNDAKKKGMPILEEKTYRKIYEPTKYEDLLSGKGANRFFYVLTEEIADKCDVPEWAGIIVISEKITEDLAGKQRERITVKKIREARLLHKGKASDNIYKTISKSVYSRFWQKMLVEQIFSK